ncbi:MAG: tRNA 2-thiouridine(34) synthase MnmA [Deltaproteobacteria bacterium]|nr:tRNA 2-thiouridine(34) synthase MnmA [Deltaproteobacteria bacterium]
MPINNSLARAQVAVALSGGMDSAMAAALLRDQGLKVVGVHLRLAAGGPSREHLEALAQGLGIPWLEMDLRADFSRQVLEYFAGEYSRGRTPNPCVRCNAAIKFGRLWYLLHEAGVPYLATGHYARLEPGEDGALELRRGRDRAKDQSYFLQRLPRELLPHLLFPLGEMTKQEVRGRYQDLGLPRAEDYRESQELCFIPKGSYQEFLLELKGSLGEPGELVDCRGRVLGHHRGLEHYTVGQRRGLRVPAAAPYYVVEIRPESNQVVLGYKNELFSSGLRATEVNWLIEPPVGELTALAVIRYRHPGVTARLYLDNPGEGRVIFETPQTAVAPGQAVAFYQEDRLLGGGWIEERVK